MTLSPGGPRANCAAPTPRSSSCCAARSATRGGCPARPGRCAGPAARRGKPSPADPKSGNVPPQVTVLAPRERPIEALVLRGPREPFRAARQDALLTHQPAGHGHAAQAVQHGVHVAVAVAVWTAGGGRVHDAEPVDSGDAAGGGRVRGGGAWRRGWIAGDCGGVGARHVTLGWV